MVSPRSRRDLVEILSRSPSRSRRGLAEISPPPGENDVLGGRRVWMRLRECLPTKSKKQAACRRRVIELRARFHFRELQCSMAPQTNKCRAAQHKYGMFDGPPARSYVQWRTERLPLRRPKRVQAFRRVPVDRLFCVSEHGQVERTLGRVACVSTLLTWTPASDLRDPTATRLFVTRYGR